MGREFPVLDGEVILTCSIIQATEIIRSLGTLGMSLFGGFERHHIFGTVGETVAGICLFGLLIALQIIVGHRRGGLFGNSHLPDSLRLLHPCCGEIVERQLVIVLGQSLHQLFQFFQKRSVAREQILLIAAAIVEEVGSESLAAQLQGLFLPSHEPQHRRLECQCLLVVGTIDQSAIQFVEGIIEPFLCHRNLGSLEIAGICQSLVPSGFPEEFVSLIEPSLVFQCEGEMIDGLPVIGVRVALLREAHGLAQIGFRLGKASLADEPESHGIETTDVIGVAAQGLLIIVHRTPGGMAVLLQVQSGEVELLVGLHLFGQQRSLGTVGNGTYLIRLGLPLHHESLLTIQFFINSETEFGESDALSSHTLHHHLLGTEHARLIEEYTACVCGEHDVQLLARGGKEFECHHSPLLLADIHEQILGCLLHNAQFPIGHEILHEPFLLIGHEPGEVGLVLCIDTGHQFYIGTESLPVDMPLLLFLGCRLVGEVAVPGSAEVSVTPGPLLLAW